MSLLPASTAQAPRAPLSWPIVVTVILFMIGTATALLYQDYQSISTSGRQRAASLSQIAAAHVQQTLSAIEASMQVLDRDPVTADIQQVLTRISRAVPALRNLQMVGANGLLMAIIDDTGAAAQDVSGSAAFQFHSTNGSDDIRLDRRDLSRAAIQISRRVNNPDGTFAGIITGELSPSYFDSFFAALDASVVELALMDGTVLVQFSAHNSAMAPILKLAPQSDAARFVAFQPLQGMPLVAAVGIDRQAFLAGWESKRNVAVALVGALIALFLGGIMAMRKHTANAIAIVALETRTRAEAIARTHADELSRRKSDFLSEMSHELRTPLNAIIGFSEVIKEASFGPVGQPKYQEYADDIHFSAQHLLSVINNILDLSKVESGKWQIAEDDIALDELFDALLRLATERATRENVRLSIKSVSAGTIIRGDKRTLLQIMLNLTVNAIKFAGPNRLVDLDVRPMQDGGIEISVADYGDGMTRDDLEKAMKPFDAPASHLNRKKQDTGLGLPLAAAFAELHGGKVILDSAPGIGTTARLKLPSSRVRLAS